MASTSNLTQRFYNLFFVVHLPFYNRFKMDYVKCFLQVCSLLVYFSIFLQHHSHTVNSAFLFVWITFWMFQRVVTLCHCHLWSEGLVSVQLHALQPSGFWSGIIWPWDYCEWSSGCGQKWLRAGLTRLMLLNCTESQPMPASAWSSSLDNTGLCGGFIPFTDPQDLMKRWSLRLFRASTYLETWLGC